jgi:hypothetical protein
MIGIGDRVFRSDSGAHGASIVDVIESIDGRSFHLVYEEGGEGWWPEECVFLTPEDRDAAIGAIGAT